MRDCGPFTDNAVFDKETHFSDIYFLDLIDNFEESPDYGQDGAFDKRICDQMLEGTHDLYSWPILVGVRSALSESLRLFL
jgi:hypothetical protein